MGSGAPAGEWLTLLAIALALGMDAFSLGIGLGVRVRRLRQLLMTSGLTGLFHFFMPLLGITFGAWINQQMGSFATLVSGGLLLALGLQMMIQIGKKHASDQQQPTNDLTVLGMIAFAASVSLDSLSVGISIGIIGVQLWLALLIFAGCATALSACGLWLGKTMNQYTGRFGEWCGGLILAGIGLQLMSNSFF